MDVFIEILEHCSTDEILLLTTIKSRQPDGFLLRNAECIM